MQALAIIYEPHPITVELCEGVIPTFKAQQISEILVSVCVYPRCGKAFENFESIFPTALIRERERERERNETSRNQFSD